ncbi:MAG: hypothetical protein ACRDD8_11890 [Bacteroidales bacterium]
MGKKSKKNELNKFLRSMGCKRRFYRNIAKQGEIKSSSWLRSICDDQCVILIALDWMQTPEGYGYWDKIHNQWVVHIALNRFFK